MGFGSLDHKICQALTCKEDAKENDEVGGNNKQGELVLVVGKQSTQGPCPDDPRLLSREWYLFK